MRAIVPEVTAAGVVIQPVAVTHKKKLYNFHPNCSSQSQQQQQQQQQQQAAYDAEIAALGAGYEETCCLD